MSKKTKKNPVPDSISIEVDMEVYRKAAEEAEKLEKEFLLKYEGTMKKSGKGVNDAPDFEDIENVMMELEADNFSNRLDNIHNNLYSSTTCTNTKVLSNVK